MDRCPIPDHEQLAWHLAEELAEKGDDRRAAERFLLHMGEELASGGDRADGREVVTAERRTQHRRLPARRICARHEWQQVEAGLIYEEDRAVFGLGFA
jgi:hypothetical protein